MSSAYSSFNNLLAEFLTDLSMTFSEYPELADAKDQFNNLLHLDSKSKLPLEAFHTAISPFGAQVTGRDPELFEKIKIPMTEKVDIGKCFRTSDDATKNAIWEYIQQLTALSTTVNTLPPSMMANIEKMTDLTLSKIKSGEITEKEAQNPMFIMKEMQKNPEILEAFTKTPLG
ncbi:unknown [Feldmannia species virus]|uniref:Uncharacterized protein n=1 Tax=Feldmannia species virus TaxID=39420 RepID=B5LWK6_9PHYC|nr:hypothetical protein FeldSpV_gp117 [Feldmannia species virus]ACH46869.1 unknown [Feldmannia species virus]